MTTLRIARPLDGPTTEIPTKRLRIIDETKVKMESGSATDDEIDASESVALNQPTKLDMAQILSILSGESGVKFDFPLDLGETASTRPSDVSSFTADQTLTLIQCVETKPSLWDASLSVSQRTKRETWDVIAAMMINKGYPVDARLCCAKFRILRDSYMRIIRKSIAKGTPASERGKNWMFFECLKFLGDGNGGPLGDTPVSTPKEDRSSSMSPDEELPEASAIDVATTYNEILMRALTSEKPISSAVSDATTESSEPSSSKAESTERCTDSPAFSGIPSKTLAFPKKNPSSMTSSGAVKKAEPRDTWSSYGEHVSDVLREMSRLSENAAWEARFAIEGMLLEHGRRLSEQAKRQAAAQ